MRDSFHMQCMAQPQINSLAIRHLATSTLALLFLIYLSTTSPARVKFILPSCSRWSQSLSEIIYDELYAFQMSELVRLQGSILATWALAVIIVCLRFLARRLSKAGLWYDDWLMIPATVCKPYITNHDNSFDNRQRSAETHMYSSSLPHCYASSTPSGVSHPSCNTSINSSELTRDFYATVIKQDVFQKFAFLTFISEICWTIAIWIIKYSILAFYWRLFSVNRRSTRIIIWILVAIATIWGLAVVCFPSFIPRAVLLRRLVSEISNGGLDFCHNFSVCPRRNYLE